MKLFAFPPPIFLILFVLFFLVSCQRKDDYTTSFSIDKQSDVQVSERSQDIPFNAPCFEPQVSLFEAQFNHYRSHNDLTDIFSKNFITGFQQLMAEQASIREQIGFSAYVANLNDDGRISVETADLLVYIYDKMNVSHDIDLTAAEAELVQLYEPNEQKGYTDFYCYVYNIMLTIYQDYYGENVIETRGDCKFKDFVQHMLQAIVDGGGIGDDINDFFEWAGLPVYEVELESLGISFYIPGTAVGGVVGGIVGLLSYDSDGCEDCGPVTRIAIRSDDDCDLTRTISAVGAGEDAAAFEWEVSDGTDFYTFTTITNTLQVTQTSASQPLLVSVRSLCASEEDDQGVTTDPLEDVEIDLSVEPGSTLGEVGDLTLSFFGCSSTNCAGPGPTSKGIFHFFSSNVGSGHIDTDFSLSPSSIGTVDFLGDTEAQITWLQTGVATVTVTATNTCSGLSTTESIQVTITN